MRRILILWGAQFQNPLKSPNGIFEAQKCDSALLEIVHPKVRFPHFSARRLILNAVNALQPAIQLRGETKSEAIVNAMHYGPRQRRQLAQCYT